MFSFYSAKSSRMTDNFNKPGNISFIPNLLRFRSCCLFFMSLHICDPFLTAVIPSLNKREPVEDALTGKAAESTVKSYSVALFFLLSFSFLCCSPFCLMFERAFIPQTLCFSWITHEHQWQTLIHLGQLLHLHTHTNTHTHKSTYKYTGTHTAWYFYLYEDFNRCNV